MDPTALPTDNLYKFMALAGLALTLAAFWLQWKLIEKDIKRLQPVGEELAQLSGQLKHSRELVDQASSVAIGAATEEDAAKAKRLAAMAEDLVAKIGYDTTMLRAKFEAFHTADPLGDAIPKWVIRGTILIGVWISTQGFIWWHDRLQVVQDAAALDAAREQKVKADLAVLELARFAAELKPTVNAAPTSSATPISSSAAPSLSSAAH